MVLLFGSNQDISSAIIDLLPQQLIVQAIQLPEGKAPALEKYNKWLQAAKLILINFDGIYQESLRVLGLIQNINPKVAIIALDTHESNTFAQHLIQQGASAYLPVTSNKETFHHCFQQFLSTSQER